MYLRKNYDEKYMNRISERTKNDPNRHTGKSSTECGCGLIHDDELKDSGEIRREVLQLLGGRCASKDCRWLSADGSLGCTDLLCLQVDHVYDDGYTDRKGGTHQYWAKVRLAVKQGSDRYQLLCANCNWKKRHTSPFSHWSSLGQRI